MIFKIGDRVYHPKNGAGQVTGRGMTKVSDLEIETLKISLVETRAMLEIPISAVSRSGLRPSSSVAVLNRAMKIFSERPRNTARRQIWTKRITEFSDKTNSGDPVQLAEAVRDVWLSGRSGDLSHTGRTIYEKGRLRLAIEMADVFGGDASDYERRIDDAIQANPAAKVDEGA